MVEDQDEVRTLAVTVLERYGYRVLSAAGGEEAIALANGFQGTIHLLLTDIVMPGMNGRALAKQLAAERALSVLFMSGYTENAIAHLGILDAGLDYIQKPFTPESLADKVREVLGPREAKATILVVDEEEAVRNLLRTVLTSAGFAVLDAINGRQAVEQVSGRPNVDLVITDLVMTEQEGIEAIGLLRAHYPHLKIIAISGAFGDDLQKAGTIIGAAVALRKPISVDELLQAVQHVLRT